ncbi:MAG: methylated-DNA--[protein]-cysteine S-methyltransferase [Polyangiaceae bacterium]
MTPTARKYRAFVDSPLGRLRLLAADVGLLGLYYPEHRHAEPKLHDEAEDAERHPVLTQARRELTEYFAGRRRDFETPLAPAQQRGGTDFQRGVWRALLDIPFGQTRSYAEIARRIGRATASRAIGAANARNPISIFVPCHRVIGGDGSLTGYAGGIDAKRWLLALESGDV